MTRFFGKAVRDMAANAFLTLVTVITISFSVLIVSTFGLVLLNISDLLDMWKGGIRVMVYLKEDCSEKKRPALEHSIRNLPGISDLKLISKTEGLMRLKSQMKHQPSFLADLKENPLPDAYEIALTPSHHHPDQIYRLAASIQQMDCIDEVEYGQLWLERFAGVLGLFRLAGYALGGLFCMAGTFIVANTIRLVLYSKREEIEIMRLIGATDGFISTPFYLQALIQGGAGGLLGTSLLYLIYFFAAIKVQGYTAFGPVSIRFFPIGFLFILLLSGMLVGLIGCFISLRQFLKG
ncbi:MAG: permease-like cell division protein FtsX [Thermodesulfobacteriota bacterium]